MNAIKPFVVIPTYNEASNIGPLVARLLALGRNLHILVVDDNSPDGTGVIADRLAQVHANVHVVHRPSKRGLGRAYVHGFKVALEKGADIIFEMDADFSHDPKYISSFFDAIEDADLVIGSRYIGGVRVEGWRFRRLLLSKLANIYVSYIMVKPVWDFTSGFRCYRGKVLESLDLDRIRSDGYAFQIEMTYLTFRHGFHVVEIPILFKEREDGYSKISRKVVWEALWVTWKCRASFREIVKHLSFLFRDYREFANGHTSRSDKLD